MSLKKKVITEEKRLDVQLRQILNNDKKKGGRLYMEGVDSFQNLSKEERSKVTIDGETLVCFDYRSFELSLLYSLEGELLPAGDPYNIHEDMPKYNKTLLREVAKKALIIMLHTANRKTAIRALNYHIADTYNLDDLYDEEKVPYSYIEVDVIFDCLLSLHEKVAHLFFNEKGEDLQYLGSSLIQNITNHFIQREILVLNVHDSVYIAAQYKEQLASVMHSAWGETFGFIENVSIVEE